jgi:hypothetical protein
VKKDFTKRGLKGNDRENEEVKQKARNFLIKPF